MNWLRKKESYFPRLAFAFLGLALSVFSWGLQYKLSLYDPPQAISHQMPEAKLLSQEERPTQAEHPLLDALRNRTIKIQCVLSGIFLLISLAFNLCRAHRRAARVPVTRTPLHLRRFICLDAFFFRPPPILA